ncbi:hypothetical protein PV326_000067 [Microctonus aethiopoides]|nr:hypothetical protein PV326_000067 [Microctonus aethiopoides]
MEVRTYSNRSSRGDELNHNESELSEIKMMPTSDSVMTSSSGATTQNDGSLSCNSGGCKSSFNRFSANESPWNLTKTLFLITAIIALIIWIIGKRQRVIIVATHHHVKLNNINDNNLAYIFEYLEKINLNEKEQQPGTSSIIENKSIYNVTIDDNDCDDDFNDRQAEQMANKNFGTLTNHDDINENDSAYINDDIDEYLTRSHLTLVDDADAGWKFWKKDKNPDSSSTTSSTSTITTITNAPSTVKSSTSASVSTGIANAADAGLPIGVGAIENSIRNNARPQQPNPGTEVGQDFLNSQPNRPGIGGIDRKNYQNWAVDFTGAGELPKNNQKSSESPVTSPKQPPASAPRPLTPSNPNSSLKNGQVGSQNPPISTPTPVNTLINGPKPPVITSTPINISNNPPKSSTPVNVPIIDQKSSKSAPLSPTGGKTWAEVASVNNQPGSPTPIPKSTQNPTNVQIKPTQSPPTRPISSGIGSAMGAGTATTTVTATSTTNTNVYSSNPVFSKGNTVTNEDLEKLSEALFIKDNNNAWRYITLNLQKKTSSGSTVDESPQPLLAVNSAALQIPTIDKVLKIYDNYHLDTTEREYISPLQRDEESLLVDTFLSTNVMSMAMKFLADKGYFKRDYYEYKYILRQIWFNLYSRGEGKIGSSGFEHVFMTELKLGTEVSGLHNWIYFNAEEVKKRADYLGYIKKLDLGNKAAIIKLHAKFNGIDKPVTSMFIGTSPELEMALYTVCFFVRPDQTCPVQLGGSKFNIVTHKFRYRNKDLVGSAYPEI